MEPSPKMAMKQLLDGWIRSHHQQLLEQITPLLEKTLAVSEMDGALLDQLEKALPPPAPALPPADTDQDLGQALDLIASAQTQGEALKRLLDGVQSFAERSAVFVVKQGIATLYAARGFEPTPPRLGTPVLPPPELEALLGGHTALIQQAGPASDALYAPLTSMHAPCVRVLPLRLRRKVVAVLFTDSGTRQHFSHLNHVRALAHAAEAALSCLAAGKDEERPAPAPEAVSPSSLTQRIPDPIHLPERPALDPKVRANAERSARVAVDDLRLYFEAKVQAGVSARNVYGSLREELDRSLATFTERYGTALELDHHIFYLAVVNGLCNGDPALLGPAPWTPSN